MTGLANKAVDVRYAYKASLIGAAHQFELTDEGLSWQIGGRAAVWPYGDIAAIRLSYRPVSMQSRRFRADIEHANRQRIAVLSTSWQTVALVAPQDKDYRAFITQLHQRMEKAGARARLIGGIGPKLYAVGIAFLALVAIAMLSNSITGALAATQSAALAATPPATTSVGHSTQGNSERNIASAWPTRSVRLSTTAA